MILFTLVGYLGMSKASLKNHTVLVLSLQALHALTLFKLISGPACVIFQFVTGKIDALDKNVTKRSERAVQLEMAHKV